MGFPWGNTRKNVRCQGRCGHLWEELLCLFEKGYAGGIVARSDSRGGGCRFGCGRIAHRTGLPHLVQERVHRRLPHGGPLRTPEDESVPLHRLQLLLRPGHDAAGIARAHGDLGVWLRQVPGCLPQKPSRGCTRICRKTGLSKPGSPIFTWAVFSPWTRSITRTRCGLCASIYPAKTWPNGK